jgi:hypothetical protein
VFRLRPLTRNCRPGEGHVRARENAYRSEGEKLRSRSPHTQVTEQRVELSPPPSYLPRRPQPSITERHCAQKRIECLERL